MGIVLTLDGGNQMSGVFKIRILDVQPSQLFISKTKLQRVCSWLNNNIESYEPIPVKRLNGRIIFTDGHTRAFSMHKMGMEYIHAYWDEDDLDWELYQVCVDWCIQEGIINISHLEKKIIDKSAYDELWMKRCEEMQKKLETKRRK